MAMLCSGSIVLSTKNEKSHFSINYATVIQKNITSRNVPRLKNQRRITSRFLRDLLDPQSISNSG